MRKGLTIVPAAFLVLAVIKTGPNWSGSPVTTRSLTRLPITWSAWALLMAYASSNTTRSHRVLKRLVVSSLYA